MKTISPKVEIIKQGNGVDELYKHIEAVGRVSYKSEEKMTDNSSKAFVEMLISNKHLSVLEHGTIYLHATDMSSLPYKKYRRNKYSAFKYIVIKDHLGCLHGHYFITTNYRVIVEKGWEKDLKYICGGFFSHIKRYTIRFTLSRAIANEFVRHRLFSFTQESTRYCNYCKNKFGNEITCIRPYSLKDGDSMKTWEQAMNAAEDTYMKLISNGVKPEVARGVLPLDLKTELIMTGTKEQWDEFFALRCSNNAHPDARKLAEKAKDLITAEELQ